MRFARLVSVAMAPAFLLLTCAEQMTPLTPIRSAPPEATRALQAADLEHVSFFVEPEVEITGETDQTNYAQSFRTAFEDSLRTVGMVLTSSRDKAQLRLAIGCNVAEYGAFGAGGLGLTQTWVKVTRGDELADRVARNGLGLDYRHEANYHRLAAENLVKGLVASSGLHAALDSIHEAAARRPPESPAAPAVAEARAPQLSQASGPAKPAFRVASPQPTAWALLVGIEKYRDVPSAPGARQDAERFAQLLRTSFGVPEDHIRIALDDRASRSDIERQLAWAKKNVSAGGRLYFFYSGHGTPDATSGTPYLLPYDGSPDAVAQSAIPMASIMAALNETPARDVVAFVDACFSGAGGRSLLPPGARPLVPIHAPPASSRVALYTAAAASEITGSTAAGDSGLFTHFVLEGLGTGQGDLDGDGAITLDELARWVGPRVSREARAANREQTPALLVGAGVDATAFQITWGLPR